MNAATPEDDDLQKAKKTSSLFQRLRNNFLAGVIVVGPIAVTVYLTWTLITFVDEVVLPKVLPLIPDQYHPDNMLPFSMPGLGLIVFAIFLIFVGSLAKNFIFKELIRIGEFWVDRMPVVRSIYNALKQIAETIFAESTNSFERACLVEYPRRGIWAVAFVSTATGGEVRQKSVGAEEMMSVFLPTTPNPTSGFLLFVPKSDVIFLDMTVEDAAKLVISAGLISPPEHQKRLNGVKADLGTPAEAANSAAIHAAEAAERPKGARASAAQAGESAARNPIGWS